MFTNWRALSSSISGYSNSCNSRFAFEHSHIQITFEPSIARRSILADSYPLSSKLVQARPLEPGTGYIIKIKFTLSKLNLHYQNSLKRKER